MVLVLLIRWNYYVCHWHGLRWHDVYIPSFLQSIMGFQAILKFCLSSLKGCEVVIIDGRDLWSKQLKWAQVAWYSTKFHDDRFRHLSNIRVIIATIWETVMLVLPINWIYGSTLSRLLHVAWCTYHISWRLVQVFQAILRFCLRNLRSCNIGITDRTDLWITPLRWAWIQ
jgi:hypothetical protein